MTDDKNHPDDIPEPGATEVQGDQERRSSGASFGALNTFLNSDQFKLSGAFDELFKSNTPLMKSMSAAVRDIQSIPKFPGGITAQFETLGPGLGYTIPESMRESFKILSNNLISKNLMAGAALGYKNYRPQPPGRQAVYSSDMSRPADYFEPWERVINSFSDLQESVTLICGHHPDSTFLWRGQQNAEWPLHSSLYRRLWEAKGVHGPNKTHRETEPFPTEDDMVEAEIRILSAVREKWSFPDPAALSAFARLQHFGAPTRLLDVTRNPLIAAWFAVEKSFKDADENADARLFALATTPVARTKSQANHDMQVSRIDLDTASSFVPFWHIGEEDKEDISVLGNWGTGRIRRFWIPPHYEQRIAAQNAAFVLDGIPANIAELNKYYVKGGGQEGVWSLADRLAASSIGVRFSSPGRGAGKNIAEATPPSFTFRITSEAKLKIRKELEERYSYNRSTIYPDIQGVAQSIRDDLSFFK